MDSSLLSLYSPNNNVTVNLLEGSLASSKLSMSFGKMCFAQNLPIYNYAGIMFDTFILYYIIILYYYPFSHNNDKVCTKGKACRSTTELQ